MHHADIVGHGGMPAICSGMPTKHSTISTTPVMYAITRYRSTAAFTVSSPASRFTSWRPATGLVLDLGIEPGQVGVVGAELLVLVSVLARVGLARVGLARRWTGPRWLGWPDAGRRSPATAALSGISPRRIRNSSLIVLAQKTTAKPANSGHSNV